MPCSCFGKKDKKCGVVAEEKYRSRDSKSREREPPSVAAPPQAPPPAAATPPPQPPLTPTTGGDARLRPEDDPDKANRRRDVVASFYSDQCELIGFKATGSRPPSTHVGSTVDGPAATSSPAASSPGSTRSAASCRAELAEKRREFFKQLTLEDDNSSCGGSRPISRLTDPGSHTTPRHSQEYHHYSLPHPPKPTPRAFKYSLPLTPLHPSATPAASEETQPLLQPTNEHDPAVHHELIGSSEAPQVPVDASEPPGQAWVVEAPVCVAEPPQDVPQQDKDRPGLPSSPIPADLPSSEAASEPLLQLSAETQHLGEVRVWGGPEQLEGEPITGAPPHYDVSTQDYSQELLRVSPADCSQVLINVIPPVIEDLPTNDNSQVLVSVSTTVVEDSSTSDSSQVLVSVPSSVKVDSSEAVVSEDLVESAAVTVNTAASEQSQRCLEQKQYVQQTSVQSDDERVAEGSCILINEAFPPQPQEAAAKQGNNHIICHTTPSPPHELRHNNVSVEDELSQRSHISTTVAAQELPLASTDEGYDEVSRQSALHPDIIEHSQQQDTQRMVPEAVVRPELEEIVLNNHHEQVHQALSFTVDPYFLTSAEEPEDLQIEQMLHQSGPQLEEKHLPKQRSQLPEVHVQHYNQVKSTVEIVECIPKVSPPLESALPLRMAPSPLNTVEAALPLVMTATTRQDEVEPLPPAPPTPPVEDEPLPPPPPTPPLLDEPLPPAPPTPPISSEPRLPPATCGVHLMSSSVMEDDGLGSEIDDALSSLECLSEEGNSSERAAAS